MSSSVSACTAPISQKRRDIKAGADPTDLRRRRADTTTSLRKQKKEQGLAKRRNTASSASASTSCMAGAGLAVQPASAVHVAGSHWTVTAADVPQLTQTLGGTDAALRIEAARGLRKVLSLESNPPVSEVIQAGAMPLLVRCLDEHTNTDLQFEAAWALTNIASTCKTRAVVDHSAVPALVRNLRHHNADLREQCAWCLGNIAGDSAELRNIALNTPDALDGLLLNVTQPAAPSLLRNCVWALSNMCRGKPQPEINTVVKALPVLLALLSSEDKEVLVDTCWALSYVSDGSSERITTVMSSGVVAPLISLLQHEDNSVVTPALRTLGNFVTGNDIQTQAVLDCGVLSHLEVLLHHSKKNIRKEACWTLSNIVAGTPEQMTVLCESPGILPGVIELLSSDVWEVQKEANFVVSNIATSSSAARSRQLVDCGAIPALCDMLGRGDAKVILVALDAISSILANDDESKGLPWVQMVDESGGLDLLEQLQEHENSTVYDKAIYIIERFYGCDEDADEDTSVAPAAMIGATTFTFGGGSKGSLDETVTPVKSPSTCGLELNNSSVDPALAEFGSPVRTLNFA